MKITRKGSQAATNTQPRKRRWLRWLIELLIIIGLIMGIRAWQQKDAVSGPAPDIQSITIEGTPVSLSDYRGQPLLLHFWASWCPICRFEESGINKLVGDYPVLTVAFQSGDKNEVAGYMKERGIDNWPTIVDIDGRLSDQYGVRGVPTTYIIDADGTIRFVEVGLTTSWGLRARLAWLALLDRFKTASVN